MKNNQNLFFSPEEKGRAFSDVLKEVQEYISSKYSTLMVEGGSEEVKQQVKRYITKYICDYRITVKGKTQEQLIDDLYTEMAEFSFLTKYIFGTGIEEIDINSWRDIEIQYNDGRCEKLEEHFESPEHAVNVIRRMLHVSGMVLDNASPAVLGHLSKNIRIAVLKTPLVDEDVGIAASIRIVNPQSLKKENFVDGGTATGEMLDFLAECLRYGISICVAGATSSGKTTLAGWLLTTIPDGKRIFTIENGSRELALVREKDGKVTNSVIHTLTRYSENEKQNIDQDMLLDMALRFNPEIMDSLGKLYEAKADAESEAKEEADSQAQQTVAAAEMVAAGDKACLEKDYVGAKVYYTMAVTKYSEVSDTAGEEAVQKKLDAVEQKLSVQEEQKNKAAACESRGEICRQSGDLWGAKSQYLSAKSIYQELGSDEAVQRIEGILSDIDAQIGQDGM